MDLTPASKMQWTTVEHLIPVINAYTIEHVGLNQSFYLRLNIFLHSSIITIYALCRQ